MNNPYNYQKSSALPAKLLGKNDKIIPIDYGYTDDIVDMDWIFIKRKA